MSGPHATAERARTVLVVDGGSLSRALIASPLADAGYRVVECAADGNVCGAAAAQLPDVVIVPGGEGLGILRALKRDDRLRAGPVLVVSPTLEGDDVGASFALGAADHLRPPLRPEEVVARVNRAVSADARVRDQAAEIVALRERNTRLHATTRRMEALALIDDLTGIYNRRYLVGHGEGLLARASRTERPLAALLLDADGFKSVNDRYGHRVGDEVLRELAAYIEDSLRPADVFGRWGGDEFLVLAPDTDAEGAGALARRLEAIVVRPAAPGGSPGTPVGVSVGWALSGTDGLAGLVHRADAALYAAKAVRRRSP